MAKFPTKGQLDWSAPLKAYIDETASAVAGKDGEDGHSPVVTVAGDQLAVDGKVTGPHLTGPKGPQGPSGPSGPAGKNATVLFVNDLSEVPAGTPADTLVVVR